MSKVAKLLDVILLSPKRLIPRHTLNDILNVSGHNFLSFDNQHTKSPKKQCRTYALNLMSKFPKLLDETRSNGEWFSIFSTFLQNC